MPKRLSYITVTRVIESWDKAKNKPQFEEVVGTSLLLKLFELEPRTKMVFHFNLDYNPTPAELKESGNLMFAIRMLESLDAALSMLGPETEILYEVLSDLGRRHVSYGVSPHFFPFFGQALVYALEKFLGDAWTPDIKVLWLDLYDSLSGIIMKTMLDVHLQHMMPSELALPPESLGSTGSSNHRNRRNVSPKRS